MNYTFSYWEQSTFLQYNFIVIGAGTVGLHTAIELATKHPTKKIAVLERGILPTGASTRNAGFACMGSATELISNLQTEDETTVANLFEMRYTGLQKTRALLNDAAIGYTLNGSYELLTTTQTDALNKLSYLNKLLYPILKTDAFIANNTIIKSSKFNTTYFTHAIQNLQEAELDSGMLIQALWQKATSLGVQVYTGCTVNSINNNANGNAIFCNTNTNNAIQFSAEQTIICTNAFINNLLPTVDVQPGRGQIIITKPINNLPFKGIYHFNEGYYYFRVINNRVLFGGGRNLDKATETTNTFAANENIIHELQNLLSTNILPNIPHEVDYNWSGIMAFGNSKLPIIQQVNNTTFIAVRCGGMGVAIGSKMAEQVVALI
jgi:gamma-glutamylputrescine oxidase